MSELTKCNYCKLLIIIKNASREGKVARVMNGNVYVLYPHETLDTRSPDDGNTQWVAWMMEIPDHCVC
jgi:hypothetical protein